MSAWRSLLELLSWCPIIKLCHWNSFEDIQMTWWRHQMETFSALLVIYAGNSPVPGEFPTHRPVTRSFDVFFDLRLDKRLSKQSWGWWFETLSCPLWRHCNELQRLDYMIGYQNCSPSNDCRATRGQNGWSLILSFYYSQLQYRWVRARET